ncbi:hypothetical protein ACIA5H_29330 [Nocardia sp. NPDC051900]|uniref:hypothetical protein n=1 Tax=Nocardia sp. NPDC051900 TaxID=3364326 RepID=UPI003795633D
MNRHVIVVPPRACASADPEVAHQQMRRHRACRIEQCAWKWVAYCTLVQSGRMVPQQFSPRERLIVAVSPSPSTTASVDGRSRGRRTW